MSEANNLILLQEHADNVLNAQSFNKHLRLMRRIRDIKISLDNRDWRIEDLCYKLRLPSVDIPVFDLISERLETCFIITPLDCFWEGNQIHGPRFPITLPRMFSAFGRTNLDWSNINPAIIMNLLKISYPHYDWTILHQLERAGVTSGYTRKPCLDPSDMNCPQTAPNHSTRKPVNVTDWIQNGCSGVAKNYMNWTESMIFGGISRNSSGYITQSSVLKSVISMKTADELYYHNKITMRKSVNEWNLEQAEKILQEFSAEFSRVVSEENALTHGDDTYNTLTHADITRTMNEFAQIPFIQYSVSIICVLLLCGFFHLKIRSCPHSYYTLCSILVLQTILCVTMSISIISLCGLKLNILTLQALTLLVTVFMISDSFLIIDNYKQVLQTDEILTQSPSSLMLPRVGSCLLSRLFIIAGVVSTLLFNERIILNNVAYQVLICICVHYISLLLLTPVYVNLDHLRIEYHKYDACCCQSHKEDGAGKTSAAPHTCNSQPQNLNEILRKVYSYASYRLTVILISISLLITSCYGVTQISMGLELSDLVNKSSTVHRSIETESQQFGAQNMYIVLQGNTRYERPEIQTSLRALYKTIMNDEHVDSEHSTSRFWLDLMANWLTDLQSSFDSDSAAGCFHELGWYSNASTHAKLAYKLLIQTGNSEYQLDRRRASTVRLVSHNGVINEQGFYNYLTVWRSTDSLGYEYTQSLLRPEIEVYYNEADEFWIPKSSWIKYSQIPVTLKNLHNSLQVLSFVREIRMICENFTNSGISVYPSGFIFSFYQPLVNTKQFYIIISLSFGIVFLLSTLSLLNLWALSIHITILSISLIETTGFYILFNAQLNNYTLSTFVLILAHAAITQLYVMKRYMTFMGDRSTQAVNMLVVSWETVCGSMLVIPAAVGILSMSASSLIKSNILIPMLIYTITGFWNKLLLLPVILYVVGPPADFHPISDLDTITSFIQAEKPPTDREKANHTANRKVTNSQKPKRKDKSKTYKSSHSLSTISEESTQLSNRTPEKQTIDQSNGDTRMKLLSDSQRRDSALNGNRIVPTSTIAPVTTTSYLNGDEILTRATVTVEVHTRIPQPLHNCNNAVNNDALNNHTNPT